MIDLSVLVCSVDTRYFSFAPRVLSQVFSQRSELNRPERVEVIVLTDTRRMTIGAKRNWLVQMASGRYVQFIDDDDRIAEDAIAQILGATHHDADAICFPVEVRHGGGPPRICHYSKHFGSDQNTATGYKRLPNHICAVKREIALHVPFADICMGEDADYARRLAPHLHSEVQIEKPLYYYDYDPRTSESRR